MLDLDRVAFPASTVTAVRGVNGAGKTTLARIVTGLQRSTGTVRLAGKPLSRQLGQRASAIVMQDVSASCSPHHRRAEIDFAGHPTRRRPSTRLGSATALDLAHLTERHPLSLSGGQQQRLVIAAMRVAGRRIVVFDEPSSGVDRRHLQSISDQIRQVAATGAVVLLIATTRICSRWPPTSS